MGSHCRANEGYCITQCKCYINMAKPEIFVCVSPNSHVQLLTQSVMELRGGGFGEGLEQEGGACLSLLSATCHVSIHQESSHLETRKRAVAKNLTVLAP